MSPETNTTRRLRLYLLLLQRNIHERTHQGENHLVLDLHNVLGQQEDGRTELARNTNRILGILSALLIILTRRDDVPVHALANGIEQFQEEDTRLETRVLEAGHARGLASLGDLTIGPLDHVVFGDRFAADLQALQDGEHVVSHHLPHCTRGGRAVSTFICTK
jgi:hypothetical protein